MLFREAELADVQQMHSVRLSVTENKLSTPGLITLAHYADYLIHRGKGWICAIGTQVVGFAMVDLPGHNVWALFVAPPLEGRGIGRRLHDDMLNWYFQQSDVPIWLGTAPSTRAEKFYRRAGWKEVGVHGKGEIKFEMTLLNWNDQINGRIDKSR